jgi:hypothetical protein
MTVTDVIAADAHVDVIKDNGDSIPSSESLKHTPFRSAETLNDWSPELSSVVRIVLTVERVKEFFRERGSGKIAASWLYTGSFLLLVLLLMLS